MSEEYPSTTLILVRHAQARADDGSYDMDTPLSEIGRRQAAATAGNLASVTPPTVVYASPLPRALETAEPLCAILGVQALVDSRLAEFELASYSLETAKERPDLLLWHPEHQGVQDGETLHQFSERVAAFCEEVVERHLRERVALVSHSGTIDATIRWSLGIPPSNPWQHEFDITNASVTEIEFFPRGRTRGGAPRYAVLWRIGDDAHLVGLASDI